MFRFGQNEKGIAQGRKVKGKAAKTNLKQQTECLR
jgi:hypothetical protein